MGNLIAQFVRFLGIGFLNTGVGLAIFNSFAFYFDKFTGLAVGVFTIISFLIAVIHSYFWNRYLVFGKAPGELGLAANLGQFAVAGLMGAVVILATAYGSAKEFTYWFYVFLLALLLISELIFWFVFHISRNMPARKSPREFALFIVITAVGALIQFLITTIVTDLVPPQFGINQGLWTNLAYAMATGVSLVWNFAGYKIMLFKK